MLYKEAARILERVKKKEGSVKSLVLSSVYQNIKQLYALVCEALKYRQILLEIFEISELLYEEGRVLNEELAVVLVYDFLFGKGIHSGLQKSLKDAVYRNKFALNAALAKIKIKYKVSRNEDLLTAGKNGKPQVLLPRYVRVNLIKTTVAKVCKQFEKEGYRQVETEGTTYEEYIDVLKNLEGKSYILDAHLDDLLVFAHGCDLHAHSLYVNGDIILQDKASCLPAHCLRAPGGAHVFDTCAAPGNKTSHVASLVGNKGKIFSFDLDPKRASTMKKLLASAKVTCSEVKVMDFLKVKGTDSLYKDVRYAMVDPSCSGSGIVSRLDHLTNDDESSNSERLDKLASFQSSILLHALSFPVMERVVYSTCSVHEKENEQVVQKVLQNCGDNFVLEEVLPTIPSRGHPIFPECEKTLRLNPERDATNGFFVACFRRKTLGNNRENHYNSTDENCDVSESDTAANTEINPSNHSNKKGKKRKKSKSKDIESSQLEDSPSSSTKRSKPNNDKTQVDLMKKSDVSNEKNIKKKKKKRRGKLRPVTGKS